MKRINEYIELLESQPVGTVYISHAEFLMKMDDTWWFKSVGGESVWRADLTSIALAMQSIDSRPKGKFGWYLS